jgi:hypothetical protein
MAPPLCRLADGGQHGGGLETVESRLQAIVVPCTGAAADERQDLVRRGGHQTRGLQAGVSRLDDLRGGPDQHIGVPDGRHAVVGHGLDPYGDRAGAVVDRPDTLRFGQREERIGHEVLGVTRCEIAGQRPEQVELVPLADALVLEGHVWPPLSADTRRVGERVHVRLCRQHGPGPGIGGRRLGPAVGPGLEIVDRVHDSAADLPVGWARTVGSVFLKGTSGEAEKTCGFRRSQKARRQAGGRIGHANDSVVLTRAVEGRRRNDGHGGGDSRAGRMTNWALWLAIPPAPDVERG